MYKRAKARLDSKGIGLLAGVELNLKLSQTTIGDYGLYVATEPSKSYFHAIVLASIDDIEQLSNKVDKLFVDAGIFAQGDVDSVANGTMSRKSLSIKADGKAIDLAELQTALQPLPHYFIPHESKGAGTYLTTFRLDVPTGVKQKLTVIIVIACFITIMVKLLKGAKKAVDEFRIVLAGNTIARLLRSYSAMPRSFRR